MERRTALALAAATAGTLMAAGAAFAANVGLLEPDKTAPISVVDEASTTTTAPLDPTVVTIIVEDPPVQVPAPVVDPAAPPAVATDPAVVSDDSSYDDDAEDDDSYEDDSDDESEDDDRHESESESEEDDDD